MQHSEPMAEGARIFVICNACRYCEGYCAVFPAMERRLDFAAGDLAYLANLCHDCGECYYACQYAPPHEFAVNLPKTLAAIRGTTWRRYAWPASFAGLYDRNRLVAALVVAMALAGLMLLALTVSGARLWPSARSDFYAILPHPVMATLFGLAALYVIAAIAIGFARFCRDVDEPVAALLQPSPSAEAFRDGLRLRYLRGGGAGCAHPDALSGIARRTFHHLTLYGFLLCFAATVVATLYHYGFGWRAPYAYGSLPVVLGTIGGIGLVVGPLGFLWLASRRERETSDVDQQQLNTAFTTMLLLTSASGLLLLGLRDSAAMGVLLVAHLAIVLALFLILPYGKFMHAVYRLAALLRYAVERKRPPLDVGGEA